MKFEAGNFNDHLLRNYRRLKSVKKKKHTHTHTHTQGTLHEDLRTVFVAGDIQSPQKRSFRVEWYQAIRTVFEGFLLFVILQACTEIQI